MPLSVACVEEISATRIQTHHHFASDVNGVPICLSAWGDGFCNQNGDSSSVCLQIASKMVPILGHIKNLPPVVICILSKLCLGDTSNKGMFCNLQDVIESISVNWEIAAVVGELWDKIK